MRIKNIWNRGTQIGIGLAVAVGSARVAARLDLRLLPPVHEARRIAAQTEKLPVYRYSVVPGGVHSAAGLHHALLTDPVARGHYLGFNASRAHLMRAVADQRYYVSYRKEKRIFWTRKPLVIPKGELLITDGENYARTRCGNRLSLTPPPGTVDAPPQPSEAALDSLEGLPWGDSQPQLASAAFPSPDHIANQEAGRQAQAVASDNAKSAAGGRLGNSGGAQRPGAEAASEFSRRTVANQTGTGTDQIQTGVDRNGRTDSRANQSNPSAITSATRGTASSRRAPVLSVLLPPAARFSPYPVYSGLGPQTDFNYLIPPVITTPQRTADVNLLPPDYHSTEKDVLGAHPPTESSLLETPAHPSGPGATASPNPGPQFSLLSGPLVEIKRPEPVVPEPGTLSFLLLTIGAAAIHRLGFRRRPNLRR